jgi:flagellar basal-body rod protein FlgB
MKPVEVEKMAENIFGLTGRRMDHISKHLKVVAQNIENLSTPAYREKEIVPFGEMVKGTPFSMTRTHPAHFDVARPKDRGVRLSPETEEDITGNNVNARTQLTSANQAGSDHTQANHLYKTHVDMLEKALSVSGNR